MSSSPIDFLNLFVDPPGDLLYFLVIIAISQAGLFMALGQRLRFPGEHTVRRYVLATFGVVVTWILMLAGALFSLLSNQDSASILPPLEAAANIITILLLGWAFITADHSYQRRLSNIMLLSAISAVIIGYILTGVQWIEMFESIPFTQSSYGIVWTIIPMIVSIFGILLTARYFRLIVDSPLKLVFFVLLAIGYGGTLYLIWQEQINEHYAGTVRIAFVAAFTMMPAIVYRMVVAQLQTTVNEITAASQPIDLSSKPAIAYESSSDVAPVAPPVGSSPIETESVKLLKTLGLILEAGTAADIPIQIVKAAMDVMRADVGALLRLQDANYADITCAFDRVMNRDVSGNALNLNDQPTLVNVLERLKQRTLYAERNIDELQDLYTRMDIEQLGIAYLQPLIRQKEVIAVLLIAMPYSNRELLQSEIELLKGISIISSNLLALSYAAQDANVRAEERAIQAMIEGVTPGEVEDSRVIAARAEMEASMQLARDQIGQLSRQVMELKLQLDDERSRIAMALSGSEEGLSASQQIVTLNLQQDELRQERDTLAKQLKDAEAVVTSATATSDEALADSMIGSLSREKDELVEERFRLQQQLDDLRAKDRTIMPQDVQQMLRQAMEEKSRLETERDELSGKLHGLQQQLQGLGIEDGAANFAQLVGNLYEERAALRSKINALQVERDILRNVQGRIEVTGDQGDESETQTKKLQNELKNLASDREAAVKQRDKYRSERDELAENLDAVKEHRARLLAQSSGYEIELGEAHEEQSKLRTEIQQLADERSDLIRVRDQVMADNRTLEMKYNQLISQLEGELSASPVVSEGEAESLKEMVDQLSNERNQLERELNELRVALSNAENKLDQSRLTGEFQVVSDQIQSNQLHDPQVLISLVQELRTPMTSIIGFIDLLLGESPGILGELQRNFLRRVLVNIARLTSMVKDLELITELNTGHFQLQLVPVNITTLVEDILSETTNQFHEKGLTLELQLDDELPTITADRDALNQTIGQLLTNAYLVSSNNAKIAISVAQRKMILSSPETETEVVVMSVADQGGGIAAVDIPHVFDRKYKAENPLIAGLSDTGVGMWIARALVQAHQGQLWVESQEGAGSTFYFALPLISGIKD